MHVSTRYQQVIHNSDTHPKGTNIGVGMLGFSSIVLKLYSCILPYNRHSSVYLHYHVWYVRVYSLVCGCFS